MWFVAGFTLETRVFHCGWSPLGFSVKRNSCLACIRKARARWQLSFSSSHTEISSVSKDSWRKTVLLEWMLMICYGAVWIEIIHGQIRCLQWVNGLQINTHLNGLKNLAFSLLSMCQNKWNSDLMQWLLQVRKLMERSPD